MKLFTLPISDCTQCTFFKMDVKKSHLEKSNKFFCMNTIEGQEVYSNYIEKKIFPEFCPFQDVKEKN